MIKEDIFSQLVKKIIQEQESIIGPLAIEQAKKVPGLKINWINHEVFVEGDKKSTLEGLAKQYESIFGQASIEVCKEIVHSMINKLSKNEIPGLLQ